MKEKVFEIAAGKLVYFPSKNQKEPVDKARIYEQYARGVSFGDIAEQSGISRARAGRLAATFTDDISLLLLSQYVNIFPSEDVKIEHLRLGSISV